MSPSRKGAASSWNCRPCFPARGKRVMSQEIRILLVDDHSLFRESLSRLLEAEPDFLIGGDLRDRERRVDGAGGRAVDVVLLDFDLGDEQGSAFLEGARRQRFEGRILMVTAGMGDAVTLGA